MYKFFAIDKPLGLVNFVNCCGILILRLLNFCGRDSKTRYFCYILYFYKIFPFAAVRKEQIPTKIGVKSYNSCVNIACLFNIVVSLLPEGMVQFLLKLSDCKHKNTSLSLSFYLIFLQNCLN